MGRRTFAWLNIAVAFSSTSKASTATAGAPIAATAAHLIAVETRISIGMEPRAGRHVDVEIGVVHAVEPPERGTAWKVTCWK